MTTLRNFARMLLAAGFLALSSICAWAQTTPWMNASSLRNYVVSQMGTSVYATKIECRLDQTGKLVVRFHTKRVSGQKPFFKWQFLIVKPSELKTAINRIPRTEQPNLRYRVVSESKVGSDVVCAVLYR